jgi:hypothetical protein
MASGEFTDQNAEPAERDQPALAAPPRATMPQGRGDERRYAVLTVDPPGAS